MKKAIQVIVGVLLLIFVIWIYFFLEEIFLFLGLVYNENTKTIIDLVILNIVVYLIRTILLRFVNYFLMGKFIRYILSLTINIIWAGFIFALIGFVAPLILTIIIPFLASAVGFTARDRINNIVAGILIFTSGAFKVGDLIEIKGVQGIVQEISLNNTKIKRNDGLFHFIPNTVMYNAAVKKFTHSKAYEYSSEETIETSEQESIIKKYSTKISDIIAKEETITRYIKIVQILAQNHPEQIDILLTKIFNKYEKIFGFRPFYYVNSTILDRVSITLQIVSNKPELIQLYLNSFMRDIVYTLYEDDIYAEWDEEKLIIPSESEEVK
ncbi:MAG: putative MscS family protein YkuT [Promethearchaeota archaeon]|nr:MAG: putative MscS family protein YkuT [Candidatus Lokiarchaeota archaeon]